MIELANDRWFPVINTVFAGGAAALWYLSSGQIGWPLLAAILIPWFLRIAAGRSPFRRTRLDGWLLLFGITAVIGTFTAYDAANAQGKLWVIVGSMALYLAVVSVSRRDVWLLAGGTGPIGALLALYFVFSNDWRLWPAELGMFNRLGLRWMGLRPSFGLPVLHPNTLAGMMALLLPFIIAFGLFAWHKRQMRWLQLAAATGVITAGGLLLTSSLGAWLSLTAGLGLWLLWEISGRWQRKLRFSRRTIFRTAVVVLLAAGLLLVVVASVSGIGHASGRLVLARQTWFLIQDFAITGSGLATFPALYAQYIQVTPVFFAAYSNLFLDVWLELGFVALVALLVLMGGSFWLLLEQSEFSLKVKQPDETGERSRRWRSDKMNSDDLVLFRWGALVSLVVMLLHGLVDDALFGSYASPLLFFAPAMVVLVTRQSEAETAVPFIKRLARWGVAVGVTAVLLVALFVSLRRPIVAQWYANLGALALARAELVGWPTDQWDSGQNLDRFDEATAYFEQALALDPDNRTALHRLGVMAMVARAYETAVSHLVQANAQAPNHRGVGKSLGYSYVWQGLYDQAVPYLIQLPEVRTEMAVYAGWWQRQSRPAFAARANQMMVILEENFLSIP